MKQILSYGVCFLAFLGLFACTASKGNTSSEAAATSAQSNQIHVLLNGQHSPEKLVEQLAAYEVQSRGRTSRTENKYLLVFNTQKIEAEVLLQKILAMAEVIEASLLPAPNQ